MSWVCPRRLSAPCVGEVEPQTRGLPGNLPIVGVTDAGLVTTYTDTELVDGRQYCYRVTAYDESGCESEFKKTLCSIPIAEKRASRSG